MGLALLPNLVLLIAFVVLVCFGQQLHHVRAQSTREEAKALDSIIQSYAYKALVNPITGKIYNATSQLPSNLTGIDIAALRLRSGSLRRKGYHVYNEFNISKGLFATPYVKRLVLVYQNLGKFSSRYYPLPNYTYLAPVLGLLAYDGTNLSATNLSELTVVAYGDPVKIKFNDVKQAPGGSVAQCVWFDLEGASNFTNVTGGGNTCLTSSQGHFSIVAKSAVSPPLPGPPKGKKKSNHKKVWIVVGSVLGGLVLLVLLWLLVLWIKKYKQKKKMQRMERAAEVGEALRMASVGDTKAPSATVTRTQPTLEHEYAP